METLFTKDNITLLISILGACAWLPILIDKLKKPKIECKILGYDWIDDAKFRYSIPFEGQLDRVINGNIYVIRMRLISRNKDLKIRRFQVKVKFGSMQQEVEAEVVYSSGITIPEIDCEYDADIYKNVLFCPILKMDEITDLETHFVVESKKSDIEYVKFIFVSTKNKKHIIKVEKEDFKYGKKIFT